LGIADFVILRFSGPAAKEISKSQNPVFKPEAQQVILVNIPHGSSPLFPRRVSPIQISISSQIIWRTLRLIKRNSGQQDDLLRMKI
jgi:hypothetical protein